MSAPVAAKFVVSSLAATSRMGLIVVGLGLVALGPAGSPAVQAAWVFTQAEVAAVLAGAPAAPDADAAVEGPSADLQGVDEGLDDADDWADADLPDA